MNPLITIVGPSGVGKTTLIHALQTHHNFATAYEQHTERPFQELFKKDTKFALANQLDYLLFRAEQERLLRLESKPALMDGGFDLDFYGFTRLFHTHDWLSEPEFDLCRRLHTLTRHLLPAPDLIIALSADSQIIGERLASRNRINIASSEDAELLERYIHEWLETVPESNILRLNVSSEGRDYPHSVPIILDKIKALRG